MKNREKKLLAGMLCLTLMAGLLTGCGGKEESVGGTPEETVSGESSEADEKAAGEAEGQITLTYLETQPTETKTAMVQELLDAFMVENPGIKVEMISTPNDQAAEKMFNLAAANQLPDVIEMNDSWLALLTSSGNIEDLSPYVESWEE